VVVFVTFFIHSQSPVIVLINTLKYSYVLVLLQ